MANRRCVKVSHPSRGAAEAHLRSLTKLDTSYDGKVYPCIYCHGWHIGRAKKLLHKNKYK